MNTNLESRVRCAPAHASFSPVLLLGHGSSGTSILSRLLRQYLRISFGTESQFIPRYARNLSRYGDLSFDANLRRLIEDLAQERWFSRCHTKWGYQPRVNDLLRAVKERTLRGVVDAIFLDLARHNDMAPRWGDKTPEYALHLDVLEELFPDAQYVHLVRDGRDVALSVLGRYWGPKNVHCAATEWCDAVNRIDTFLDKLPAERSLTIRYEDLLTNPVTTFRELIGFLNIDDRDGTLLESIGPQIERDLIRSNFDKWRTGFTVRQRRRFEGIASDTLRRHDYDTLRSSRTASPGIAERSLWTCHNRLRKWTFADYWRDNFSKLRLQTSELRTRLVLRPLNMRLEPRRTVPTSR